MPASRILVLATLALGVALSAASGLQRPDDGITGFFEVLSPDGSVQKVPGEVPEGNPDSPVHIEGFFGNETFIPGGSNRFTGGVEGGDAAALAIGFEGMNEHFEVELLQMSFEFTISLSQDFSGSSLALVVVPILGDDSYGKALRIEQRVQMVGTGNLQVSLSWDTATDVDLHLIEPDETEIFYSSRSSSSGGELDLDSNAGCTLDNVNNENITYGKNEPPSGHYIVRVDYYAACGITEQTRYLVTVNKKGGGKATIYEGEFVPEDEDGGSAGSGVTVAEFDY